MRKGARLLEKRWPGFLQLGLLLKFLILSGWLTWCWYLRRTTLGVCVWTTRLNKACPADPVALPRIDQIIDAMVGCERLSFLDAYSGYHQIKMAVKDQEKMAFL